MKIRNVDFELSAVRPAQWPVDGLPEFAFVGRSNVGKSSLLNRLLGRKALARVSAKPGKTQQINFFRVNDQLRFADLPGYGYAAVGKAERAHFAKMVETYLRNRKPLVRVFHLIDIRHDPTALDVSVHRWLVDLGRPVTVVCTKLDKVSKSKVQPSVARVRRVLETAASVIPVSAEQRIGLDALWQVLERELVSDVEGASATDGDAGAAEVLGEGETGPPVDR
ncbi:MAG: ribosome biogenesis GTP-binding protein YihA/YsxC [Alicyclobacillus sp.]|nr:ribosome biogenesis GTP-binding protein YihA/YsxC [Alicyclobacillus sp.]